MNITLNDKNNRLVGYIKLPEISISLKDDEKYSRENNAIYSRKISSWNPITNHIGLLQGTNRYESGLEDWTDFGRNTPSLQDKTLLLEELDA